MEPLKMLRLHPRKKSWLHGPQCGHRTMDRLHTFVADTAARIS